jgi:hopanoid-associated phosphorylase
MIAALTGLAAEAEIARRAGLTATATGGGARTLAAAERLLAEGATALVSFGIAGALAPDLAPGALLLPRRVLAEDGDAFVVDAALHARLAVALGLVADERDLLGAQRIVGAPADKAALHRRTGAAAVDLESGYVAAAAARRGRPFIVLRAVADPAGFALPRAAAVGLDAAGNVAIAPVLRALLRAPWQIGALVRVALHTRHALATLSRAVPSLARLSRPAPDG